MTTQEQELAINEIAKLVAVLRTTDRYSDLTKPPAMWQKETLVIANETTMSQGAAEVLKSSSASPSSTPGETPVVPAPVITNTPSQSSNLVSTLLELERSIRVLKKVDISSLVAAFIQVLVDPSLSGFVTGAGLQGLSHLVPHFVDNPLCVNAVIDGVVRTRFTETDRDHDEIVLIRIVSLIEFVLTKSSVVDKARIASGLQCVQTIWIQDSHSSALKDASRRAVYNILLHVLTRSDGCDGYAVTLMENVCLNIELLSKQPPNLFDRDKLSFFVEVLAAVGRLAPVDTLGFQIVHALHFLLPPGPMALSVDNSAPGVLSRNSTGLPIVASLLRMGNQFIHNNVTKNANRAGPLLIEALVSSMYLRPLLPLTESGCLSLSGYGETAIELMTTKKSVSLQMAPNGYINLVQSAAITQQLSPHTQQTQATVVEALIQLLAEPGLVGTLWESFDCVWHRQELVSGLIDSLVSVALSNRVIALIPQDEEKKEKIPKTLNAFYALATSPESIIDPDALVPSYVECLGMRGFASVLDSLRADTYSKTEDQTPTQFLVRLSSRECGKQIKNKPKKTAEIVSQFLTEYERAIKPPDSDLGSAKTIAWTLRMMPSLDFDSLGEFFGQPGDVSTQALSEFIRSLNLKSMDPEEALRACLQSFRLPGEAQQIDRIVKEVAYEYYRAHADLSVVGNYFASADAAYTFLFSVIMLNTDQHNPQVKRRMELRDFVRNNRKINEGGDIPEDVQMRVFNSIRSSQIVTPKSASHFCAPLKGRWKDLWFLHESGYLPSGLRNAGKHTIHRLLAAKGYDILIAASYVLARDPQCHTEALAVISSLAELALTGDGSVKPLGQDAISVIKRYAVKSFATNISNIQPTVRSFNCLRAMLSMTVVGDSLIEALSALLCYWSAYEFIIPLNGEKNKLSIPHSWKGILSVPLVDVQTSASGGGAIGSLIRGFFYDQQSETAKAETSGQQLSSESLVSGTTGQWREAVTRMSFAEGSPNAPPADQLNRLRTVQVSEYLGELIRENPEKTSAVILMMFEIISGTGKQIPENFWSKELVRSSPWALLLATRLLALSQNTDLIAASTARDAVIAVIRNYASGQINDIRGLKITVFSAFALTVLFAQKDPESSVVDPAWILPVLDELSTLAGEIPIAASVSPALCLSLQMMLEEAPENWLNKVGAPVWRECVKICSVFCPKSSDVGRSVCLDTAELLLSNPFVLRSFVAAANGSNDAADCVVAVEQILSAKPQGVGKSVSKSLSDLACKIAGLYDAGVVWTALVGRVTARITAVAKQKKPTGIELSDSVELLRICLGDPRGHQILSPVQAGLTVERAASALSAIVSANTPGGALQAALCVFVRFFLSCLEKLQQHPQFDHLWLMSLRVILLFIKRGHDDTAMEQLAEITTETLRNALQVLVASGLLQLPPQQAEEAPHVWWKVTWEIVETFCPGMWSELTPLSAEVEVVVPPDSDEDLDSRTEGSKVVSPGSEKRRDPMIDSRALSPENIADNVNEEEAKEMKTQGREEMTQELKSMSGASAVFITDSRGKVILWRNYRGEVSPAVAERFVINVVEESEESSIKPVFVEDGICYCWIKFNNLYFLAVSKRNTNAVMLLAYLYKLAEVLKDYFKQVEEESIRDNFVLTYELMDEMMDNGIPQTTEVKILREYIKTESFQLLTGQTEQMRPPTAITNAVSWRPEGIKHKKNEVFLDVVEKLNLLVSANGTVLRSEILGTLKMKTFLSGMPELKLGLNDKLMLDAAGGSASSGKTGGRAVEMEDIKFHQCVRLSRFENDRTISFIPPDGEFELMSYRLNTHVKPLIWIETVVDRSSSRTRVEYMVKAKSQYKARSVANNVEILIPVPSDVDSPNFKTSIGSVKYLPGKDAMLWTIRQFAGQKDYIMTATFGLPSVASETRDAYQKRPISVKFEIPYFTVSGVTVRYLKIVEKSGYQALPWVRYITQNGEYQLRMT